MRYRTPILQRVPFIVRHAVFHRTPIITRVPVRCDRNSFAVKSEDFMRCKLYQLGVDCSGCEYYDMEDNLDNFEDYKKFVLIRADVITERELIERIETVERSGKYIRMLTSHEVSQEVIKSLAYSPYNILQFNLDLTKPDNDNGVLYFANKCGIIVSLYLSPVIPTVVKVSQVLSIIDRYNSVVDYFCIRFFKKYVNCNFLEEFVAINDVMVPSKFLEVRDEHLICSMDYTNKFLDIVNTYAKPRNVNIVLCDNNSCY